MLKWLKDDDSRTARALLGDLLTKKRNARKIRLRIYIPLSVAASILIIVTAIFVLRQNSTQLHKDLFVAYFEDFPAKPSTRGISNDSLTYFSQLYELKKYTEALPGLLRYAQVDDPNNYYNLNVACIHLNLNKSELARSWSRSTQKSNDKILREYSIWYTALSYLQSGDNSNASKYLEKLIELEGFQFDEAVELRKELE